MGAVKELRTAGDFHEFFSKIDEERWVCWDFCRGEKCCAVGHVRKAVGAGTVALPLRTSFYSDGGLTELLRDSGILKKDGYATNINDGDHPNYQQFTPKARMLAALKDAMKRELPNLNEAP